MASQYQRKSFVCQQDKRKNRWRTNEFWSLEIGRSLLVHKKMICNKCQLEKDSREFKDRGWRWCRPCINSYKNDLKTKKRRSEGVPELEKKYLTMRVGDNLFRCRKCREIKNGDSFSQSQLRPRGRGWCRPCITDHVKPGHKGHEVWKAANERYIASGKQKTAHRN